MSRFYDAIKQAGRTETTVRPQLLPADPADQAPRTPALAPVPDQRPVVAPGKIEGASQIARNILAIRANERPRVLLITSSNSGDGTSYVAAHLAEALSARRTRRVLLVDANLHDPSQHLAVGLTRSHGLSEVLVQGHNYEAAVHGTNTYSVLVSGRQTQDPCSLFETNVARALFSRLRKDYDFIVIDSPAAREHPDASVLASLADASILVVQAESTRFEEAEEARDLLLQTGTPILGGVLNRQREYIPKWLRRFL